ncbi:sensor histidine kinase [Qipengyuania qiaonensis]|uniref:histidine kinase n=1 Tax=Qipengyuania qiaonensis TaxID=2867240 RepID=A0ABS7J0T6_9SPHN|nr:histidine kinase dimerization/phosphoacceptor domain -containing protein [Qipengyuania qiaonensis]MBX7480950.1 ATP-binding protein [Qipengyuania qiaonensis]
MYRLASFDVSRQFVTRRGKLIAQITFGALCSVSMIGLRTLFDIWAPLSGPFALIYPTILLATLYGHWIAGLAAFGVTFAWAWFFVLPMPSSFFFSDPTDPPRVVLNAICALIVLIFAEAFRRAAHTTMNEISERADRRLTLLADLEHRTKNNFALVASMLELQKRRIPQRELHAPLDDAVGRVRTFADAYTALALEQSDDPSVEMKPYLDYLLNRVEASSLPPSVRLFREIDIATLSRKEAVAIGLYLNEAVSNACKYAFPNDRSGTIAVFFHVREGAWRFTIEDDGIGDDAVSSPGGGLGSQLLMAFAAQAEATHHAGPVLNGYRTEMRKAHFAELA